MNRASLINVFVALTLIGVIGWQSWTLIQVNGRLAVVETPARGAALEDLQAAFNDGDAAAARVGTKEEACQIKQAPEAFRDEGAPVSDDTIADMVKETIERHQAERHRDHVNRWFANATEHHQNLLAEVGKTHDLSDETLADALDVFIGAWERGAEIKEEVHEGTMNWADAKAEEEALRTETKASVTDILGEDAAEDLWARMFDQKGE